MHHWVASHVYKDMFSFLHFVHISLLRWSSEIKKKEGPDWQWRAKLFQSTTAWVCEEGILLHQFHRCWLLQPKQEKKAFCKVIIPSDCGNPHPLIWALGRIDLPSTVYWRHKSKLLQPRDEEEMLEKAHKPFYCGPHWSELLQLRVEPAVLSWKYPCCLLQLWQVPQQHVPAPGLAVRLSLWGSVWHWVQRLE